MLDLRFARKLAVGVVLAVILNFAATCFIEFQRYSEKRDFVSMAVRQAADYTRVNLQSISGARYTGATGYSRDKMIAYCNDVLAQATSKGVSTTWLEQSLEKIKKSAGTVTAFTPLNFGLTYLDPEDFETVFSEAFQDTVDYNFGTDTEAPVGEGGYEWDTLQVDDIRVTVSGPNVVALSSDNTVAASLFGNYNEDFSSSGINFNYVVSYDIRIEVDWGSVTTLPLFNADIGLPRYSGGRAELTGQTVIKSPDTMVFQTTYVLTN